MVLTSVDRSTERCFYRKEQKKKKKHLRCSAVGVLGPGSARTDSSVFKKPELENRSRPWHRAEQTFKSPSDFQTGFQRTLPHAARLCSPPKKLAKIKLLIEAPSNTPRPFGGRCSPPRSGRFSRSSPGPPGVSEPPGAPQEGLPREALGWVCTAGTPAQGRKGRSRSRAPVSPSPPCAVRERGGGRFPAPSPVPHGAPGASRPPPAAIAGAEGVGEGAAGGGRGGAVRGGGGRRRRRRKEEGSELGVALATSRPSPRHGP